MTEHLFVYGTLQDPEVQKRLIGRTVRSESDVLEGHATEQITLSEGTYPILVEAPDKQVEGMILSITQDDFEALDEYETNAYKRVRVELKSGTKAWVYKKND